MTTAEQLKDIKNQNQRVEELLITLVEAPHFCSQHQTLMDSITHIETIVSNLVQNEVVFEALQKQSQRTQRCWVKIASFIGWSLVIVGAAAITGYYAGS